MNIAKIMIAAFSATNVMTTFSYLMSIHYKKLFKEPVLLNYILDDLHLCPKGKWKFISGWLAHYIIGLFFAFLYALIWEYTRLKFGIISGIVLGIVSGFIGILGWKLIYKLPRKEPHVRLKEYYVQLFFAHVLFACVIVIGFMLYEYDPVEKIGNAF